jgi:hypothetical protein
LPHRHAQGGQEPEVPLRRIRSGLILCGFGLIAAVYLLTEHTTYVFGAPPYLLILACPLMHVFMHHGGHGSGHRGSDKDSAA